MMSSQENQEILSTTPVQLDRVGMRYEQGRDILSEINLILSPGSFTFLTGPSGAGKSTLLQLMSLRLKPTRGLISLFGERTEKLDGPNIQRIKRRIGFVSQDFNLIPHLNIFENVALPLRVCGETRETYSENVIELLRWVGLGDRLDHFPRTLSGGEKQRVAIARAVIAKPDLLLADEPTGNVDPDMARRLLRMFLEMNRTGTTILIATHDTGLLNEIQADTYHLENGQVIQKAQL